MALDQNEFEVLLAQIKMHAERAASENEPQHYQAAFQVSLEVMRMLAEDSGAWRQMVARATEEFEGDEGI